MNKLHTNNTASRGLGRIMTLIAGTAALLMIAGSAHALTIDLSSYSGGNAEITHGDHSISISEYRSRLGRQVTITINDGQRFRVDAVRAAVGRRLPTVAVAGRDVEILRRERRGSRIGVAHFDNEATTHISLFSAYRIRLRSIDVTIPNRPEPVTAVPEPGAALLFGTGIVLAGLRRRQ